MYCQHCGNPVEDQHEPTPEEAAETVSRAEANASVEIARIEKEKEIALAKIAAGMVHQEQEVELAATEVALELTEDALEATQEPEPGDDIGSPVVIVSDSGDSEDSGDTELPPADDEPSDSQPVTESKSRGYGNAAWFGDR
jgi:hypothetical protein